MSDDEEWDYRVTARAREDLRALLDFLADAGERLGEFIGRLGKLEGLLAGVGRLPPTDRLGADHPLAGHVAVRQHFARTECLDLLGVDPEVRRGGFAIGGVQAVDDLVVGLRNHALRSVGLALVGNRRDDPLVPALGEDRDQLAASALHVVVGVDVGRSAFGREVVDLVDEQQALPPGPCA